MGRYIHHSSFSDPRNPRICSARIALASAAVSGGSVSGKKHTILNHPVETTVKLSTDTAKCPSMSASSGATEKPTEKPAKSMPKLAARHCGGMTSDSADKETATQLTKPEIDSQR